MKRITLSIAKFCVILLLFLIIPSFCFAQKIPISKESNTKPIYIVELYAAFKNIKTYPLSFVVEEVNYIPLEKTKDCLIGDHLANIFIG